MFAVRASHGGAADPCAPEERRLRALVLDGDAASLSALQRAFGELRAAAIGAPDGAAGLGRLLDELLSLDAVVLDLDLPLRDARAFARLVRQAGNEQDLALVVLAPDPTPALRGELAALGVDAVVDRRLGPGVAAAATLEAVDARRARREREPGPWRDAPAASSLGETSWWALDSGEPAMVA